MKPTTEQRIEAIREVIVEKYGLSRMHGTTVEFIGEILAADPLTDWAKEAEQEIENLRYELLEERP